MEHKLQTPEGSDSTAQQSAAEFLLQVYDELRRLAACRLANEKPGQTLAPAALVHEAWLRLVHQQDHHWKDSRHFFFAAATAMRRILIDNARRKARTKHGGKFARVELNETALASPMKSEELLALDEALGRFAVQEPQAALLVELRYFAGLGHQQAAELLGISRRNADGLWAYARARLLADRRSQGKHECRERLIQPLVQKGVDLAPLKDESTSFMKKRSDCNRGLLASGRAWLRGITGLVIALAAVGTSAEVRYVNLNNATPSPPYADWASAATNIQDAVDAAGVGDTVLVTNGIYNTGSRSIGSGLLTSRVVIVRGVRLESVNGPSVTTIEGAPAPQGDRDGNGEGAIRCVYLETNATIFGFTLTKGHTRTTGDFTADQGGGGAWCSGPLALIANCVIKGNSAGWGGGAYGGTLQNCVLYNNSAHFYGGGAYGNSVSVCILNNCTITGNSSNWGGGASWCRLNNCIVLFNALSNGTFSDSSSNYDSECLLNFCCTAPPATNGMGNISADAQLSTLSHLSAGSPCRGAANSAYSQGLDIDREAWASPPSIGCDEFHDTGADASLFVSIAATFTNVSAGSPLCFTALIEGRATESIWNFGDGVTLSNTPYASHTWSAPGDYELVLRAFNESTPDGVSASLIVHVTSHPIFYVDAQSANPLSPYTNWLTAARNIQDAVDAAIPGALVLVTNGVYDQGSKAMVDTMSNRVVLDKQLTMQSVNGPLLTIIQGSQVRGTINGDEAIRCVYLADGAVLSGFTLTNGATLKSGSDWYNDQSGGGVWCQSTQAVVSNCVIAGNSAAYGGGGVYSGTLYDCVLTGNSVKGVNGSKNSAGGGAFYSTLIGCTIARNRAEGDYGCGGGVVGSILDHCLVKDNSAMLDGGGVYWSCSLTNCTLIGNSAGGYGGGASGQLDGGPCVFYNCFLTDNSSGSGGGASGSRLYNCTLTGNSVDHFTGISAYSGGGVSFCSLRNCIVYYNTAVWGTPNYDPASTLTNCCTTPLPDHGSGNMSFEPELGSSSHLSAHSPCLGAGLVGSAIGTDIDGEAWAHRPSIGCDEYHVGEATGPLTVAILAGLTNAVIGTPVPFKGVIEGQTVASVWNFGDGVIVSNRPYASHVWTMAGDYAVELRAVNDRDPDGVVATVAVHVAGQLIHYVAASGTNPVSPFTSWTTAATNIQDAVDVATTGDEIIVGDGIYATGGRALSTNQLQNRVVVTNLVSLRSANGPQVTFIQGAQAPSGGNGDGAIRCVYLANGSSLSGFTLTNGATRTSGDFEKEQAGGGVFCESSSATLSNCVLVGNTAFFGGGAYRGTLYNCLLNTNSATGNDFGGGGAYQSILYNCTVTGNSANTFAGGGVSDGTLYNCIVYYNTALFESNYRHSLLNYCATTPVPTNGVGNAPLFVDPKGGDFHLQAVSPCINAGNNAYLPGAKDFDGNPRVAGGTVDIGAYEFQNPRSIISYDWLERYGLPTDGSADFVDTDGDGLNNHQEWRAGTNPTDPRSVLRMLTASPDARGLVIRWQSVSGQTYSVERATDLLASPAFQTIATGVAGQADETAYSDTNAVGAGPFFYRVSVR